MTKGIKVKIWLLLIHLTIFYSFTLSAEDNITCSNTGETLEVSNKAIVELSKEVGITDALFLKNYNQCEVGLIKDLVKAGNWSLKEIFKLCIPHSDYCRVSPHDGCYIDEQASLNSTCYCINNHSAKKNYGKIWFP